MNPAFWRFQYCGLNDKSVGCQWQSPRITRFFGEAQKVMNESLIVDIARLHCWSLLFLCALVLPSWNVYKYGSHSWETWFFKRLYFQSVLIYNTTWLMFANILYCDGYVSVWSWRWTKRKCFDLRWCVFVTVIVSVKVTKSQLCWIVLRQLNTT